jgi:putative membrane protein insertion efficiency factor
MPKRPLSSPEHSRVPRQADAKELQGAARALLVPLRAYRRLLSPILPPSCRFSPSCSAYAITALERHGALRGMVMTMTRIARCNRWHPGGYDPVPPVGA